VDSAAFADKDFKMLTQEFREQDEESPAAEEAKPNADGEPTDEPKAE
jgi:hypothetical protein